MANKTEFVSALMNVQESPQGKGVAMTLRITYYDNGIVNINGHAIGNASNNLVTATRLILQGLEELERHHQGHKSSTQEN